jgi:hypothetical protein
VYIVLKLTEMKMGFFRNELTVFATFEFEECAVFAAKCRLTGSNDQLRFTRVTRENVANENQVECWKGSTLQLNLKWVNVVTCNIFRFPENSSLENSSSEHS